jgi:hypothetical protein
MTQLLSYVGTDPKLVAEALHRFEDVIDDVAEARGCGIGYEQESRMLLRKRHLRRPELLNLARQGGDLQTRGFLAQVVTASGRQVPPADLQPFRWKSWLFGCVGDVPEGPRSTELAALPDFLRRNVQGDSSEELLFHRVLLRLRARTSDLSHPRVLSEDVLAALVETTEEAEGPLGLILCDSRRIFAVVVGDVQLAWARVDGVRSFREKPLFAGHKPKHIEYPHMKAAVLVDYSGELPDGWTAVVPGTAIAFSAEGAVDVVDIPSTP